ncbi:GumC family protein [Calditrichota bacterium]
MPEKVAKVNFYDFLLLLVKWRKIFIVNLIIAGVLSSAIALLLPVIYTSTTTILPAEGSGGSSLPGFLSADLVGVASNFGFDVGGDEMYKTILESRTLRERIIERFHLRQVYKLSENLPYEDVIRIFNSKVTVAVIDNGSISLSVSDTDPQRAADIANACIEELDKYHSQISSETASKERKFIESRMVAIRDSINDIQEELIQFQETTNVLNVESQTDAMFKSASEIKAKQLEMEIKYRVISENLGSGHPLVHQMHTAINDLGQQFEDVMSGAGSDMYLGMNELPSLGQRYTNILRGLRIQNKILEYIYPQYENARIKEARETANVRILDYAKPPEIKSKPARKLIVLTTLAATFFFTLILVLIRDYWANLSKSNSSDYLKVQEIVNTFRKR